MAGFNAISWPCHLSPFLASLRFKDTVPRTAAAPPLLDS